MPVGPDGVLNLLKPPGMTSHDIVYRVRRLGFPKAGHTGTLDPGAAGVLPVCVGRATRISEYLGALGKGYRAEITLGVTTSTDDGSGAVVSRTDASQVTNDDVEQALVRFVGEMEQVAPVLSAKKFRGVRSYDIVRAGGVPERRTVRVRVYAAKLVRFEPGAVARATVDISCSSGTYVRNICSDLGRALGCGGYMSFLLRTRSGPFRLADALTLEEMSSALEGGLPASETAGPGCAGAGPLARGFAGMAEALSFMRGAVLAAPAVERVLNGHAPSVEDVLRWVSAVSTRAGDVEGALPGDEGLFPGLVRLISEEDRLVGIARVDGSPWSEAGSIALEKVFP